MISKSLRKLGELPKLENDVKADILVHPLLLKQFSEIDIRYIDGAMRRMATR